MSWFTRGLGVIAGQVGSIDNRRYSMSMLLEAADLEEGMWYVFKTAGIRTGFIGKPNEYTHRSRENGLFSVEREFKAVHTTKSLLLDIIPLTTVEDAKGFTLLAGARILAISGASESTFDSNLSKDYILFERVAQEHGGLTNTKYAVGLVDSITFSVEGAEIGDGLSWEKVIKVANDQASKIRKVLSERLEV
jgi:hypothetical protein